MSNNNLNEFIEKIPIHDLINRYIKLKKISRLYWGLCPFHSEATPSFVVNNDKKFFYCFGCGIGGNCINFVMKYKDVSLPLALEEISTIYNLPIQHFSSLDTVIKNQQYEKKIIDFFQDYTKICHQKLMINNEALKYLYGRGVNLDFIRSFNIGYDDGNINDLIDLGYTISEMQEYGILSNEDWNSKFHNRIILPITNIQGEIISISGRTLSTNKNVVKYLHSIENSIFYKKTTFFNYHNVYKKYDSVYIVEGFFDMFSCINNNIHNVIACLGSNISDEQVFFLQKNHKNIYLLLDGDTAGLKGMINSAYKFLTYYGNTRIEFIMLPDMDPADYLNYNSLKDLPQYNLEDFLWQYVIKSQDNIIDGTSISKMYKNIDYILDYLAKNEEINKKISYLLENYWQKKLQDLVKDFYKNSNKKIIGTLPIVTNKSKILLVTLWKKCDQIMDNLDQLFKLNIEENKLYNLFNKIINNGLTSDSVNLLEIQNHIKEYLTEEEITILENPQLQLIIDYDKRSLSDILNEEYFK